MSSQPPNDEPDFGYTWEELLRARGYKEEIIQELVAKREAKHGLPVSDREIECS